MQTGQDLRYGARMLLKNPGDHFRGDIGFGARYWR